MPLYYIDTDDNDHVYIDKTGCFLIDAEAARQAALKAFPDMTKDVLPDGDCRTFVVGVRDQDGDQVYRATLTLKGEWSKGKARH